MSDRAAKQARRAKRKAKRTPQPRRVCCSCGRSLTKITAIESGGPGIASRDHCWRCFPPEVAETFLRTGGEERWITFHERHPMAGAYQAVCAVDTVDTGGLT